MPVVFQPNINWQVVAEPEWTNAGWEIKRANLLYRGPRPKKTSFEASINDFEQMPGFPGMRLEQWQSKNNTANFPGVEKMYVGFRNGIPPAKGTPSIAAATARLSGTDSTNGNKVSAQISYRASRTTWEWWEQSAPNLAFPRYNAVLNQIDPRSTIDVFQFESSNGDTTVPLSSLGTLMNNAVPEMIVTDYSIEPIIPNAIWRCTSVIDYRIRSS